MKLRRPYPPSRLLVAFVALLVLFSSAACHMNELPRNMRLRPFNPYREDFACVHEVDKLPPISAEAEALFQQGMAVTSYELWPNQRDYKQAAQLWEQAAAKGHWKAAINLADLYESGRGVEYDSEHAVRIVESLMKAGVPAAFDKMGSMHQDGIAVKGDADRAYAFWQLAADMGNPTAQTFIGRHLEATYDSPGMWANAKVARKMTECAFAQGYGKAAYQLGQSLDVLDKYYLRALRVYHEGVKFGSQDAAEVLSISFDRAIPLTGNFIDNARADRYSILGEALEQNPDLRFPNLDKVLPLPPAPLPMWDGKPETLIDAAKDLSSKARPLPSAASQRALVPSSQVLPGK